MQYNLYDVFCVLIIPYSVIYSLLEMATDYL